MPLQVKGNDKTKLEVHGSVRTWLKVMIGHRIRREVQVKGSDKTKLEVQGSVRTWLKVSLQVQGSDKTK